MNYIIHYDIAALFIIFVVIVQYYSKRRISLGVRRVFVMMLVLSACSNLLDLITVYTIENPQSVSLALDYLLNMAYLLSFNSMLMLYHVYVQESVKPFSKWSRWEYVGAFGAFAVDACLILTTAFTHGVFWFEDGVNYKHGPLMVVLYISALY